MIALVAAMGTNRVIGNAGDLPWHLPADLKFFKTLTTGHVVIMGRRTFETVGQPLPNRRNVVITRNPTYHHEGVTVAHSLDEALAVTAGEDTIFVVGGAEIYELALPYADTMFLTMVDACFDGDAFFPEVDLDDWELIEDTPHEADDRHAYSFSIRRYDRRS